MSEYIIGNDDHNGHWFTGEQIVRCRDCIHVIDIVTDIPLCGYFALTANKPAIYPTVEPNGYCSWGETSNDKVHCEKVSRTRN